MSKKQIAEVAMDEAFYLGTGEDGVYFDAGQCEDGWFVSTLVDCNTSGFCEPAVTDDGPYESRGRALEAGLDAAYDWLMTNEFYRGWRTDEKRMRRQFRRMANPPAPPIRCCHATFQTVEDWQAHASPECLPRRAKEAK